MQLVLTFLRLAMQLTLLVVLLALGLQLKALHRTLERDCIYYEQVLKEHQQFLEEHAQRMERYEGNTTGDAR
jgi:hypothetical protein